MNYYNEFDRDAAQWLRNLIAEGLIPPGDVDDRSIEDVRPADLEGYTQCHFFAGVGGWPEALRLAGVPDDTPLWTGSCPCQPYSAAGAGRGSDDPRNLWWAFRWLIDQCHPPAVIGEQVASKAGRGWLAGVRTDLEALGYAVGAADLCAASAGPEGEGWLVRGDQGDWERIILGAPHIRQRLFWVAESKRADRRRHDSDVEPAQRASGQGAREAHGDAVGGASVPGGLADGEHAERRAVGEHREDGRDRADSGRQEAHSVAGARGEVRGLADAQCNRSASRGTGRVSSPDRQATVRGTPVVDGGDDEGVPDRLADGPEHGRREERANPGGRGAGDGAERGSAGHGASGNAGRLADGDCQRRDREPVRLQSGRPDEEGDEIAGGGNAGRVSGGDEPGPQGRGERGDGAGQGAPWARSVAIECSDGKLRRIPESVFQCLADGLPEGVAGLPPDQGFPLAQGVEGRTVALKGMGNAIVPQVAAEFITAWREK